MHTFHNITSISKHAKQVGLLVADEYETHVQWQQILPGFRLKCGVRHTHWRQLFQQGQTA